MKPPELIKKGLECCVARWAATHFASCKSDCPYWGEGVWCKNVMHSDVSTYIAQLVSDNESKQKRIEELERRLNESYKESLDIIMMVDATRKLSEHYADRLAQVERERDENKALADDLVEFAKYLEEQLANSKRETQACLFDFRIAVANKSILSTCHLCKYDKSCEKLPVCNWQWRGVCEGENT